MLNRISFVVLFALGCRTATAQHCAPIFESYLSEISLKKTETGAKLRAEYRLLGGRGQETHQAYLVAYFERDAAKVPAPPGRDVLDPKAALVLETRLIKRNKAGVFEVAFDLDGEELGRKMVALGGLTGKDRIDYGDSGVYKDQIKLAIFVPFLDDKKYATLEGLPPDRHCCNYARDRALLFQALPYRVGLRVGKTREDRADSESFRLVINGDKPPKS